MKKTTEEKTNRSVYHKLKIKSITLLTLLTNHFINEQRNHI